MRNKADFTGAADNCVTPASCTEMRINTAGGGNRLTFAQGAAETDAND
jgi:hypothetical protein